MVQSIAGVVRAIREMNKLNKDTSNVACFYLKVCVLFRRVWHAD